MLQCHVMQIITIVLILIEKQKSNCGGHKRILLQARRVTNDSFRQECIPLLRTNDEVWRILSHNHILYNLRFREGNSAMVLRALLLIVPIYLF